MLEQMNQRLKGCTTFEAAVGTILRDVVALHGAEFGNVQLVAGDSLLLVDERGFELPFLVAFREVRKSDGCACARAWRSKAAVIVEDVKDDAAYAEFIEVAQEAGYRSVQSTPLIASDGTFLGVVSTLFANMHKPSGIEMETVQAYSRLAADHLQKKCPQTGIWKIGRAPCIGACTPNWADRFSTRLGCAKTASAR